MKIKLQWNEYRSDGKAIVIAIVKAKMDLSPRSALRTEMVRIENSTQFSGWVRISSICED